MKVCLFTPSLQMGGTERVVSVLANRFVQLGAEVHIILFSHHPVFYPLDSRVKVHLPDFDYSDKQRGYYLLLLFKYLRRKTREIQPDSFLSFGERYNAFSILSLSLARAKARVFISERSSPGLSSGWVFDWINPWLYRKAHGILSQTSAAAEKMYKKTQHRNIRVIGNPIIIPASHSAFSTREKVILNVGRFVKSKNQETLIRLFSQLPSSSWELWFVGDGPEYNHCREMAKSLGLEGRVKFWGKQTDVASFYSRAQVFAFTSSLEGFPNALAEAMSFGCVPVSYDCEAGPADLIQNGENGFLVPLHDEAAFLGKLIQVTTDDFDRESMGSRASQSIKKYSEEVIASETLKFLLDGTKNSN